MKREFESQIKELFTKYFYIPNQPTTEEVDELLEIEKNLTDDLFEGYVKELNSNLFTLSEPAKRDAYISENLELLSPLKDFEFEDFEFPHSFQHRSPIEKVHWDVMCYSAAISQEIEIQCRKFNIDFPELLKRNYFDTGKFNFVQVWQNVGDYSKRHFLELPAAGIYAINRKIFFEDQKHATEKDFFDSEIDMCTTELVKGQDLRFQSEVDRRLKYIQYKNYLEEKKQDLQQAQREQREQPEKSKQGFELTEKLLIIFYLQQAELFPTFTPTGLYDKTDLFKLMAALLSETQEAIKKSWNDRVVKFDKTVVPTNRKQRLEYLERVKEILAPLHNDKINSAIETAIQKIKKT